MQNYINTKYELFCITWPGAQQREIQEFYQECSEGLVNRFVRTHMFAFHADSIEGYSARAVRVVQVERRRMKIGDSEAMSPEGLLPVTRWVRSSEKQDDPLLEASPEVFATQDGRRGGGNQVT